MFYRDFMQKYRPLHAPEGPAAGSGDGAAAVEAAASPAPAATEAPPTAAAPAAETAPAAATAAPAKVEAPAAEPTLLEAAEAKAPTTEAKPDAAADGAKDTKDSATEAKADGNKKPDAKDDKKDAKPEGDKKPEGEAKPEDKKTETTAEAQPPEPIKYEAFKLPEGVKLDDEKFGKFQEIAGKGQVPQDVAQNLLDLYVEERKADTAKFEQHQRDVWKGLNDTWKADFRKDEKLGGNREQTSLAMAKAVLEEYGGSPDQVRDLLAHTKANGMGNYVGFIRLLANIGEALNVFEESEAGANPTPPKIARSRGEKWYGGSMNGKA